MFRAVFFIFVIYLMMILSTSGCGPREKADESSDYPVSIEEVDGVKTVHNPGYPKEGTHRYDLVPDLSIGGADADAEGDSMLVRPIEFQFDSIGNIYIMDWGEVMIKVFDPNGSYLRSVGRKGQGPGEFDVPAFFRIVDDKIFLLDSRSRKFSLLTLEGGYLEGFNIDGFPPDLDVAHDGTVYYSQMLNPEVELSEKTQKVKTSFALYQTDSTGEKRKKLGEFRDKVQLKRVKRSSSGAMGTMTLTSREAYTTSWFISPGGRMCIGYNRDYEIEVRDADWNAVLRFGREFTLQSHPHYEPDRGHPEYYPAFSDWRKFFDEKGYLWLEQYPNEDVEEHAFDVFSPEGIYLRKNIVPEVLFDVKEDKAFSIIRTEDDYLVFRRYRMVPVEKEQETVG